ncbi:hypothetical protein MTO96_048281 [Rhipicephalus appendiculatus]
MAYIGARGDTLEQLTLNFGYSADEINEQKILALFKEQLEAARDLPHEYTLDIANAAVAQEGYGVLPNYTQALMSSFGAEYLEADFSKKGQEAIDKINKWVSEKTHGKVRSLFEEPPDFSTRLILLNAVYYKGTWLYEFNKLRTKPRSFYNGGVTKVLIPTMKMKSTLNHTFDATLNADVVDLPYVGNDISMTILLPSERNGIEHLKSALTTQNLNKAIARNVPERHEAEAAKVQAGHQVHAQAYTRGTGHQEDILRGRRPVWYQRRQESVRLGRAAQGRTGGERRRQRGRGRDRVCDPATHGGVCHATAVAQSVRRPSVHLPHPKRQHQHYHVPGGGQRSLSHRVPLT